MFFGKKTYSKQWYESCVRGFLVFFSIFVRKKVTINENSDGNDVKISRNDDIVIFWRCFASLVKFSYWSKFHVNIIIGSEIMTISFYKGLTRNLEIGNTPFWVLPNI